MRCADKSIVINARDYPHGRRRLNHCCIGRRKTRSGQPAGSAAKTFEARPEAAAPDKAAANKSTGWAKAAHMPQKSRTIMLPGFDMGTLAAVAGTSWLLK